MKKKEPTRSLLSDLRNRLRRYRADHDLTHEGVGEKIGVSRTAIGNFEAGKSTLRADELDALFALLRSPDLVFADSLQALVDFLRSPDFSLEAKMRHLVASLDALHSLVKSNWGGIDKLTE